MILGSGVLLVGVSMLLIGDALASATPVGSLLRVALGVTAMGLGASLIGRALSGRQ